MRRTPQSVVALCVLLLPVSSALSACGGQANAARPIAATATTASPTPSRSASTSPAPKPSAKTAPKPDPLLVKPAKRPPISGLGPAGSRISTGSDAVALTFDDGPDPVNTPALLDVLKANGIKATFCLVGSRARDYPAVVARIAAEGHTICNHSWQHLQNLSARDDGYLWWDLKSTNAAILAAAPGAKISYFRAPYGEFTPRLVEFAATLGMTPIYWDADDECFQTAKYGTGQAMIDHMTSRIQSQTRPGSIILSHDMLKPHTVVAYRTIGPWLKANFRLVPLPTS
jgi:peptidoglycan/xylan/chitin deacetylase (PgdA/CDA1 family)